MITCRATPGVPMDLLRFVTRLLILERRRRCTPAGSQALTCREQAVMVLRRFRDRTRAGQLGRDHGISPATAYRYADEGTPFLIPDGKLFSTGRLDEQVTSVKDPALPRDEEQDHQPAMPCAIATHRPLADPIATVATPVPNTSTRATRRV